MLTQRVRRSTSARLRARGVTAHNLANVAWVAFVALATSALLALFVAAVVSIGQSDAKWDRQAKQQEAALNRDIAAANASLKRLNIDAELFYESYTQALVTVGRCARNYNIEWDEGLKTPTFTRQLDENTSLRLRPEELLDDMPDTCQPTPG